MSPLLLIFLIILAFAFLGGGYGWHSGYWGGAPNYAYGYGSGGLGLVVIILIVFLLLR